MKIQQTFIQGRMNKDVDERLLPSGQYPHAENIKVGTTDDSAQGVVQNLRGNFKLTNLGLTNAKAIGGYCDDSNEKIYWFVTSDEKDMVVEYVFRDEVTNILLEATSNGVLNFSKDHLITGVVKIINGDSNKDLLVWTDNLNPPRMINIERVKSFVLDGFTEDDISLIKMPPEYAPELQPVYAVNEFDNNLEDKFFSFAYRYKYLDGEFSALSSFTNYSFFPKGFQIDFQTMENKGMINAFSGVDILFNTGSHNVTDIELVLKESNSNTVYVIESFNKEKEQWGDNTTQTYNFTNNKKTRALPSDELFRTYDNVPLKAKALDLIGNRIAFGNYVEGYDFVDLQGVPIKPDYVVEQYSEPLSGQDIEVLGNNLDREIIINFENVPLKKGNTVNFTFSVSEETTIKFYRGTFNFILNQDYPLASDLASDPEFINFIESVVSNEFINNTDLTYEDPFDPTNHLDPYETWEPPADMSSYIGFKIFGSTADTITIKAPIISYSPGPSLNWYFNIGPYGTAVMTVGAALSRSLKSNRTYEAAIVYKDKYQRASLPIIDRENTVFISQYYSDFHNSLKVTINHEPPAWADSYKIVVKQDKGGYHNVFANIFYQDGIYRWVKLEGENKDKVREGDTLIVKSDLSGKLSNPVKVKVLDIVDQPKDFIEGNKLADGTTNLIEEAGLYMKIKPDGFNMDSNSATVKTFSGYQGARYPTAVKTSPVFTDPLGGTGIKAGSRVSINIRFEAFGSIGYLAEYNKQFTVQLDYPTIKDWFEAEVVDLGEFGDQYTRNGVGPNNKGTGWDFDSGTGQFWVRAHRNGTASRDIYTSVSFEIYYTDGVLIFETEPEDLNSEIFYETEQTFKIVDGKHMGNIQDQTSSLPAIVDSDFFNVFVQGGGVESYRFMDGFNTNHLNIDLRPTMVAVDEYREVRRYADITYSEPYNENNNINGLNEFNLSRANYKEDIDKNYGFIQKIYSRNNDLLVFQEDKVSKVLYGKDLLMNADGTSNLSSISQVLGQQIPYMGEYGISKNPEGFAFDGFNIYFPDVKRGAVMRLAGDGLNEISRLGMDSYFKDSFKEDINAYRVGGYDPYHNEYILNCDYSGTTTSTLSFSEDSKGWTSFYTYSPELLLGMNNYFFTFKNGELYQHHSDNVERNNFYGVSNNSKISLMYNQEPSTVKRIEAVSLEGSHSWDAMITAYLSSTDEYTRSTLNEVEFKKKDGMWYAYARRNEDVDHVDSKATYGIGRVESINGDEVVINGFNQTMVTGDYLVKGDDLSIVGEILTIAKSGSKTTITLTTTTGLLVNDFVIGTKDQRIEGSTLRGYSIRLDLESSIKTKSELYAVNAEVNKSFP